MNRQNKETPLERLSSLLQLKGGEPIAPEICMAGILTIREYERQSLMGAFNAGKDSTKNGGGKTAEAFFAEVYGSEHGVSQMHLMDEALQYARKHRHDIVLTCPEGATRPTAGEGDATVIFKNEDTDKPSLVFLLRENTMYLLDTKKQ